MKIGLREAVFFVLLLGLPLGAWWFVFKPNSAMAAKIEKDIEGKEYNLQQVTMASANIEELKKEIGSLEKAIDYFKNKLPNERQIPMIIEEISILVDQNKLKLVSISPSSTSGQVEYVPANSPYAEQAIEVKVEGDFMAFYSFLQALEALPRITRVQKLTVKGMNLSEVRAAERALQTRQFPPDRKPMGHVSVSFLMSIFYAKNPQG